MANFNGDETGVELDTVVMVALDRMDQSPWAKFNGNVGFEGMPAKRITEAVALGSPG